MMTTTIIITGAYDRRSGERVASESGASHSKRGDFMCVDCGGRSRPRAGFSPSFSASHHSTIAPHACLAV